MKLMDRLALQRLISMILSFLLAVLKLFAPKSVDDMNKPVDEDKKWRPRWRKKQ